MSNYTRNYKTSNVLSQDVSLSPSAVVAVVRFHTKKTYLFDKRKSILPDDTTVLESFDILDQTSICFVDPYTLSVSTNKDSVVGSCQVTTADLDDEIIRTVTPGDWIFAWIVPSKQKAQELKSRISKQQQVNFMDDGLEFVGRVESVRKSMQKNSQGLFTKRVTITSASFNELNMKLYYRPGLGKHDRMNNWILEASRDWEKFWDIGNDPFLPTIKEVIPFALDIFFGKGPATVTGKEEDNLQASSPETESAEATRNQNRGYCVPRTVLKLLGLQNEEPYYSNILVSLLGIQSFDNDTKAILDDPNTQWKRAIPISEPTTKEVRRQTPTPLISLFNPQLTPWSQTPALQVISSYVHPAINEMFACLKVMVNKNGEAVVLPHLVVRQKPFNTKKYFESEEDPPLPATLFSDLPTWEIKPEYVLTANVGRSNSIRFNYSEVQLVPNTSLEEMYRLINVASGDYVVNPADVRFHGFRPFISTISADPSSIDFALNDDFLDTEKIESQETRPKLIKVKSKTAPVSSGFGERDDPFEKEKDEDGKVIMVKAADGTESPKPVRKMHNGIDFAAPEKTPVPAAGAGTIRRLGNDPKGYGRFVEIDHGGGVTTLYAHLIGYGLVNQVVPLKVGDKVVQDQIIGYVGSTGRSTAPHLHYEVRVRGNPIDPATAMVPGGRIYQLPLDGEEYEGEIPVPQSVNISYVGSKWSKLAADMHFERHLSFSGSITTAGLFWPISIGDNILFDDVVYHVQGITKVINSDPARGQVSYRNTFTLVYGLEKDTLDFPELKNE